MQDENKNIKILVCDDDITHLIVMEKTLSNEGYTVITANDGRKSVVAYEQNNPDMILLDVKMPFKSGFEVCEFIRSNKTNADIPILMVTGSDDQESVERAFASGATDFLSKPINWAMITYRVKYILKNHHSLLALKSAKEKLKRIAYYDALTGLPNRQAFKKSTSIALEKSRQSNTQVAIICIGLDNFRRINDSAGRQHGDNAIKTIASRLMHSLRYCDKLLHSPFVESSDGGEDNLELDTARIDADDFAILLPEINNKDDAKLVCDRLVKTINQPIDISGYQVVIKPEIGIAISENGKESVDELMKNAETAMHLAKGKGPENPVFYINTAPDSTIDSLKYEAAIRESIVNDDFFLVFQPKVGLKDGKIVGVECLTRWEHPTMGIIPPFKFIPLAEETGLIIELGDWILREACQKAKELSLQFPEYNGSFSINVSARQLSHGSFIENVKHILNETQIDASRITFEITESLIIEDASENNSKLSELRELGIKLSIDDFGTGYSSLAYLKTFPVDELKIDRSFVNGLDHNTVDKDVVKTILLLAESLKLNVVVEGIETKTQVEILRQLETAIDVSIQGFYYYKPMPLEDLFKVFSTSLDKDVAVK
ncbi:MAG: EAL domain-containing protein [Pseudomonadota bacterium]